MFSKEWIVVSIKSKWSRVIEIKGVKCYVTENYGSCASE